jgi:hypothetical protein
MNNPSQHQLSLTQKPEDGVVSMTQPTHGLINKRNADWFK